MTPARNANQSDQAQPPRRSPGRRQVRRSRPHRVVGLRARQSFQRHRRCWHCRRSRPRCDGSQRERCSDHLTPSRDWKTASDRSTPPGNWESPLTSAISTTAVLPSGAYRVSTSAQSTHLRSGEQRRTGDSGLRRESPPHHQPPAQSQLRRGSHRGDPSRHRLSNLRCRQRSLELVGAMTTTGTALIRTHSCGHSSAGYGREDCIHERALLRASSPDSTLAATARSEIRLPICCDAGQELNCSRWAILGSNQ